MFLDKLHELNAHVTQALQQAGLNIFPLAPGEQQLPVMEFLKPDHTTISLAVPTHQMNVSADSMHHRTVSDWANTAIKFVLDAANEFNKPRIHMTPIYLNYNKLRQASAEILHFDIAIWEYADDAAHWMVIGNYGDPHRLGHDIGHHRPPVLNIDSEGHTLLKHTPFEINVWTPNILRDIGYLTASEGYGSVFQYMFKLEQELMASARVAADLLNKWQHAAQVHDTVNALWRSGKYQEAAEQLGKTMNQEVGIYEGNDKPYLVVGNNIYLPAQAFALIAGLDAQEPEDVDTDITDPLTPEQIAAGIVVTTKHTMRRDTLMQTDSVAVKAQLVRDSDPIDTSKDHLIQPEFTRDRLTAYVYRADSPSIPTAVEFFRTNDPAAALTGNLGDTPKADDEV